MINEIWTPWGASCTIGFIEPAEPKLNMMVFPNPLIIGDEIQLQTKGDWLNIQIRLTDLMGKPVLVSKSDFADATPTMVAFARLTSWYVLITFFTWKTNAYEEVPDTVSNRFKRIGLRGEVTARPSGCQWLLF